MSEKGFAVRLTANTAQYEQAMGRAKAATEGLAGSGRDLDKLGSRMKQVGGQMTKNVTVPLVALGGVAIKMSSDFESAFARMQGLAGVTADEVDDLKASVLELAGRTAQAPQALADGLYFLRSSGLDASKAMDALEMSAMASSAGLGSTAVIADAVSSAMNAYAKSGLSAAEATDILVSTARAGKAEPAELAGALGRVLPIASELGITFEDVGGAIAALSLSGNDASISATLLQNVMSKLLKPSQQGAELLSKVGMSAASIRTSIADDGLLATLELLKTQLGDAGFVRFLEDAQAVQGALALTGQNAEQVATTFGVVKDSAGSTAEAFDAMAGTSGFKMKQAWADIQVSLIQAGDIIMPIVSGIAGAISSLAHTFSDLPGPVQKIIVVFLGLLAAAGPLLIVAGSLVKNWNQVHDAMGKMPKVSGAAMGAFAILGVAAVGLGFRARHAAEELKAVQEAAEELSRGTDAEALNQLGRALAASVVAGLDLSDTYETLAHGNIEGARRVLELAEAQDYDTRITDGLRAAIEEEERATAQAATTTEEHGAAISGTMDALTAEAVASSLMQAANEALAQAEEDSAAATQAATDAINRQIDALEADLEAQQALIDFARRAADAQYALAASTEDYDRFLEELPGKLDEINKSKDSEAEKVRQTNALYREGSQAASQLADDVVTAYDEASDGAMGAKEKGDLWRQSMLNSAAAASGPVRQSILDFIFAVNEVPAEKQTAIIAAVEADDLATAIALLDGASETRKAEVVADLDEGKLATTKGELKALEDPLRAKVTVDADTSLAVMKIQSLTGGGKVFRSAGGRYVDRPMISTLGEGGKPEVVLPLSNQARMADLLSDRRVSGPILNAFGGGVKSAGGRTVNLTHTSIPAATTAPAPVVSSTLTGTFEDAQEAQDELMERMWRRDALSYEAYRDYLSKRKEGLKEYSDEEQELFDRIQQLDQNQVKQREEDARITTESADKIQKYLYETNQISLADYMAYLAGRRGSYQAYTDEWFALSYQIISVQEQMDRAAAEATDAVFRQADAVKSLADATQANQDAAGAFYAAGAHAMEVASTRGATDEEKQSALDAYNQSAVNLAQTAYNLADALANERGFTDGSIEWARFMRQRLTADSVWNHANGRENVANAVDRLLVGIPAFAAGGYVPATPGGKVVRVAEAGQGEYMVPANRMHAMAGGGTSVYAPVYHISINGAIDRPGVARELREILDEDNRRNGRR